jgi:hypothetical protein
MLYKYQYVKSNAINFVDPSGLWSNPSQKIWDLPDFPSSVDGAADYWITMMDDLLIHGCAQKLDQAQAAVIYAMSKPACKAALRGKCGSKQCTTFVRVRAWWDPLCVSAATIGRLAPAITFLGGVTLCPSICGYGTAAMASIILHEFAHSAGCYWESTAIDVQDICSNDLPVIIET